MNGNGNGNNVYKIYAKTGYDKTFKLWNVNEHVQVNRIYRGSTIPAHQIVSLVDYLRKLKSSYPDTLFQVKDGHGNVIDETILKNRAKLFSENQPFDEDSIVTSLIIWETDSVIETDPKFTNQSFLRMMSYIASRDLYLNISPYKEMVDKLKRMDILDGNGNLNMIAVKKYNIQLNGKLIKEFRNEN
jgi:hypothetical protein